jgi:dephospho-CoA kinase
MDMEKYILKVGITGGIGSGKTEVCKILEKIGEKVLSADLMAKQFTENDQDVKNQLKKIFGEKVFDKDNNLNRKLLADIVFQNKGLKDRLDRIIHPFVFEAIEVEIKKIEFTHEMIFIEAALIFESGMEEMLDYVVVVDSDEEKRINRVQQRDKKDILQIQNIFKSQMSTEEKLKKADFVIMNNGTIEDLEKRAVFIRDLLITLNK